MMSQSARKAAFAQSEHRSHPLPLQRPELPRCRRGTRSGDRRRLEVSSGISDKDGSLPVSETEDSVRRLAKCISITKSLGQLKTTPSGSFPVAVSRRCHGGNQRSPVSQSTCQSCMRPAANSSTPNTTGKLKRRGPMEPGLKTVTPWSRPMKGTCE